MKSIIKFTILSVIALVASLTVCQAQNSFSDIKNAALQGDEHAQYVIGICYRDGKFVQQDNVEAVKWFRKSAEQGFAISQCELGLCYIKGKGVQQNFAEAVKWLRKSAVQGYDDGQFLLGMCYLGGLGVKEDVSLGFEWIRKAAKQGHKAAIEALKNEESPINSSDARTGSSTSGSKLQAGQRAVKVINGVEFAFRWCPPGTFMMGSPAGESQRGNNENQHRVTLTKGFWMLETEVTQKQWKAVMGNNPSEFKGDNLPVEGVSWDDCHDFCKKCAQLGIPVELPTEAQWEYACRAGTTRPYAGNLDAMAWYDKNSNNKTNPVGTKRSNAWGLYDMHGNVSEWCEDWEGDYPSGSATDPTGPSSGSFLICRGGCWNFYYGRCRSASRGIGKHDGKSSFLGFRVVKSNNDQVYAVKPASISNNNEKTSAKEAITQQLIDEVARAISDSHTQRKIDPEGAINNLKLIRNDVRRNSYINSTQRDKLIHQLNKAISKVQQSADEMVRNNHERAMKIAEEKDKILAKRQKAAGQRGVKTINGVEFAFRWCPPGTFMMGSPESDKSANAYLHRETLAEGFWIMETEVTQKQWKAIMGNNPSYFMGDTCQLKAFRGTSVNLFANSAIRQGCLCSCQRKYNGNTLVG